jgi:hypothetical protein
MEEKQPVRHVIVFKFTSDATDDQITTTTNAFRELKNLIPGITSFEHGGNVSSEGLNQGYNHVYVVTFEDAAARDAYLPHPAHLAFVASLGETKVMQEVLVIDYIPAA